MMPSGFISTSLGVTGCINSADASLLNGAKDRPWKEEDQSTLFPTESTGTALGVGNFGSSKRPLERERWFLGLVRSASDEEASFRVETAGLEGIGVVAFVVEVVGLYTAEGVDALAAAVVDVLRAVVVGRARLTAAAGPGVIALRAKFRCTLLLRVNAALRDVREKDAADDCRDAKMPLQRGLVCDATIVLWSLRAIREEADAPTGRGKLRAKKSGFQNTLALGKPHLQHSVTVDQQISFRFLAWLSINFIVILIKTEI
jgi:hypothetical protein